MSGETVITIAGNLVAPAELRFTPSGAAVASFTVASTPRTFDKTAQEWRDGETLFLRCSAWREMAENIAESLSEKGTRVIAQGRLTQRSYDTREGEKRTSIELQVDEVGPSLRRATAKVTRKAPGNVPGYNTDSARRSSSGYAPAGGAVDDPWAVDNGKPVLNDEPPF